MEDLNDNSLEIEVMPLSPNHTTAIQKYLHNLFMCTGRITLVGTILAVGVAFVTLKNESDDIPLLITVQSLSSKGCIPNTRYEIENAQIAEVAAIINPDGSIPRVEEVSITDFGHEDQQALDIILEKPVGQDTLRHANSVTFTCISHDNSSLEYGILGHNGQSLQAIPTFNAVKPEG